MLAQLVPERQRVLAGNATIAGPGAANVGQNESTNSLTGVNLLTGLTSLSAATSPSLQPTATEAAGIPGQNLAKNLGRMTKNQRTRARKAEAKHREKTLLASEIPEDLPDNLREARTITSRGEISSYITFSEQGKCLLCKDGECDGGTILVIGDQAIAPLVKAEPHREADEKSCGLQMDYIVTPNMSISDLTIMLDQVFNASTESQILGPAEDYTCCRGHFSDRFTDVILSFTVAYESAQVKDATGEFLNSLGQLALSLKTYLPHVDPSCLHILSPILRPNLTPTGWSSYTSSNQYISHLNQTRTHNSLPNLPGLFQEDDLIMTGWEETDQDGMNTEGPLPTMNLFNPNCLLKSDWSLEND